MSSKYSDVKLHINGKWREAIAAETLDVINPATEEIIGTVAHARIPDLDEALDRVHKSNMSKLDDTGKPIYREDGKVLKSTKYKPPMLIDLV